MNTFLSEISKARQAVKKASKRRHRPQRIEKIAKKLTVRAEKRFDRLVIEGEKKGRRPFTKKPLPAKPRLKPFVAYDLETTRIKKKGTPAPLYITAFSNEFSYSGRVSSIENLGQTLIDNFLLTEHNGFRFVAWNGNRFDVYFIAAALLHHPEYVLRPYLTRTKNLRGMKVILRNEAGEIDKKCLSWEFLDGMSMTGIQKPLTDFLKVFAPEYGKLTAPNWETEEFDYRNKSHVEYAERDSEGLYRALVAAQEIIKDNFGIGLKPTIGNMGIRIFQSEMPDGVSVFFPPYSVVNNIRDYAMRGGYCFCVRKYEGPIWKYDINQAYAAAMRESWLPSGRCYAIKAPSKYANCGVYRIRASNPKNTVPFYYRDIETGKSQFGVNEIRDTWITSQEYDQLKAEKWVIEFLEGYAWESAFRMSGYVNKLEHLRINGPGGPKSAQGEMIKAVGNNSYGKTVERLEGMELVLTREPPQGWFPYQSEDDLLQHLWFKFGEPQVRDYHQPQIGAFITAYVRMVLRRAININPEGWLYADTDCVAFDSPVDLPLSATQYGYWKQETDGEHYRIIAKKVYASVGAKEKHAKGLNIKRLTDDDFKDWFNGIVPIQEQTQRQNFVAVMAGFDMFIERTRRGTSV